VRGGLLCAALLLLSTTIVEADNRHEPPRYRIEKLQGIEGIPTKIDSQGAITGQGVTPPSSESFPYLWTKQRTIILQADPPTIAVMGNAVNDKGQVAGILKGPDPVRTRGFVWTRGRFVEIGDLPGGSSVSSAADINKAGQVAGASDSAKGRECILWKRGTLMSIGDLPGGDVRCEALAINRSGEIVGWSQTDRDVRPFIWRQGTMTELPLPPEASQGFAVDINRRGDVVGSFTVGFARAGAIVWSNGEMNLLPTRRGLIPTARGINDRGDIVGWLGAGGGPLVAVLWHHGVPVDLRDLVADEDPLKACTRLEAAEAINNRGEIAATGVDECATPNPPGIYRLVPIKGKNRK
jgi:probable HAF family extracellular repeat protein